MTFVQIGVFDWLSGRQKGSTFVKCLKIFFSETILRMKPKLDILAKDTTLYKSYVFFISVGYKLWLLWLFKVSIDL